MKLSSREKILMIALAMAGFMAAFYYLLLSPQLLVLGAAKVQAEEYRVKVEEMKAQMDPNHPIYADIKIKQAEVTERTARLYPAILQDKLITVLDEKFKSAGLNPDEITFVRTSKTVGAVQKKGTAQKKGNAPAIDLTALRQSYIGIGKTETVNAEIPEIFRMNELTANITSKNVVGEYQKLISFIAALEKDKYKIILNSISMETKDTNTVESNFSVSFISVPKMFEDGDKDYLGWLFNYSSNKYNPLLASGNLNPGETAPAPVLTTPVPVTPSTPTPTPTTTPKVTIPTPAPPAPSKSSDFAITLRPISSDVPTVLVGKVNDKGAGVYVYADNPNFENVEVQILESGGKLYYRYKTTSDNYPANYSEMAAFTSKSTGVVIEVISTKRTGSDDTSGINLTVINKSNKKVSVSIKNDDVSKSRVKISSTSGSVTVKR
jgi:type IV pilus assembly protein PilO